MQGGARCRRPKLHAELHDDQITTLQILVRAAGRRDWPLRWRERG